MARIPLRAYNKEIDQMVENGQAAEAVAHCKHILKYFPKHIDTYRLLGQAYLTDQRYTEAADILQRVLSVVPDDFISQIGMSLIREDEGNLDAAIYHMEKAFEVQPSKSAIQGELRRLYGRRDGVEPPKIRLTRGALVRMYMRGELYAQAIAEVRAALADDPQQLDLEVILARLYALSGQKVQAVEICSRLVSKLPYCLEANRILAEVLPGTTRAEDARVFSDRLHALDPYTAFLPEGSQDPAGVPDAAVQLERLEYNAAAEAAEQPEWTRTAGVAWEEAEQPEVPSWLQESGAEAPAKSEEPAQSARPGPEAAEPAAAPAEIPDWMAAAGWSTSSGEAVETPMELGEEEELPTEEGLASPGQIPDWLQSLAPEAPAAIEETTAEEDQAWLQNLVGEATPAAETPAAPPAAVEPPPAVEELPVATGSEENLPDWLQEMKAGESETVGEAPATVAEAPESAEELPDWLQELKVEAPEAPLEAAQAVEEAPLAESAEELPEWLQGLKAEEPEAAAEVPQAEAAEAVPDWLQGLGGETGEEVPPAAAEMPAEPALGEAAASEEALPDWLQGLNAGEVEQPVEEAEAAASLPEWLQQEQTEATAEETTLEAAAEAEEELPEWLQQETQPETLAEPAPAETVPDWLMAAEEVSAVGGEETPFPSAVEETVETRVEEISPVEETLEVPVVEAAPVEAVEIPPEMPEAETVMPEAEIEAVEIETEKPAEVIETPTAGQPAAAFNPEEDLDSALAWLESLAAKQGVDESELLTQPEQRAQEIPDWIKEAEAAQLVEAVQTEETSPEAEIPGEAAAEIEQAPEPVTGALVFPVESVEEAPEEEVVQSQTGAIGLPVEEAEPVAESEISAETWAEEPVAVVEEAAKTQPLRVAPPIETPEMAEETAPVEVETLETAAEETVEGEAVVSEEAVPEAAEEQAPEMLEAVSTPEAAVEMPEQVGEAPVEAPAETGMPEDLDAALAWLESLAEKQGVNEAELLTQPEQRAQEVPSWIKEAEAAQAEKIQPTAEPLGAEEIAAEQPVEVPEIAAEAPVEETAASEQPVDAEAPTEAAPVIETSGWVVEAETAAPAGEEPIPDWLQDLEFAEKEEEPAPAEAAQTAEALPSWLQDLEAGAEEPSAVAETTAGEWAPENAAEEAPAVEALVEEAEPVEERFEVPSVETEQLEEETRPVPVAVESIPPEAAVPMDVPAETTGNLLEEARKALEHGEIETALGCYASLTNNGEQLEEIIHDLRDATYRFPMNTDIWQALGDAYRQGNHVQDALDAYTKAIELLR